MGELPGSDLRYLGHRDLEWTLNPGPNRSFHNRSLSRKETAVGRLEILLVVFTQLSAAVLGK